MYTVSGMEVQESVTPPNELYNSTQVVAMHGDKTETDYIR